MRTINAPGVEIREHDLSQYSQTLTGTKVLVTGFASKGQDYVTQQPTSRSSLLNMYGEPKSEAERYFYTACMEVINQGGTLYSAKLPYDNILKDNYVKVEYAIEYNSSSDSSSDISSDISSEIEAVTNIDETVKEYITIKSVSDTPVSILSNNVFAEYELGESKPENLTIVDISRAKYGKTINKTDGFNQEILGIIPVITTASNALYYQMLLSTDATSNGDQFNAVGSITSLNSDTLSTCYNGINFFTIGEDDLAIPLGVQADDTTYPDCVSLRAAAQFPALFFDENGKLDREHLKKLGIVVFKAYTDVTRGNRINFELVESFIGELDPNATDPTTGATTFIDAIVNSSSEYIRCFSPSIGSGNIAKYNRADILFIKNQTAGSLGAYEFMTTKAIALDFSILEGVQRIFDTNSDINDKEIDIVVDGGISTIGQYIGSLNNKRGLYFGDTIDTEASKLAENTTIWRSILNKYDHFCKNVRKDCMYIADIPRAFGIQGTKKIIRPSKPTNTIDNNIIPNLRYTAGTNSNYGAGYAVWFEVMDDFTGETFWCPPSIQASGIYINTDTNYHMWDAPAGLTRGIVTNALDSTFSPNMKQAGSIYLKNWNYAITYPTEGVILEGQKTFQTKPSAFDRVNVRRLFLRLERYAYKIARYYVYEPNNSYTRQRFVDQLTPYFNEIKNSGGIYDFYIICDETINTPEVIDNNELKCRIGIKPTKTIEFIELQFVALRTGGSWEEMMTI